MDARPAGRVTAVARGGSARASTGANLTSPLGIHMGKRLFVQGTCLAALCCGTHVETGKMAWASQEAQRLQA